jgi:hypothetical protein
MKETDGTIVKEAISLSTTWVAEVEAGREECSTVECELRGEAVSTEGGPFSIARHIRKYTSAECRLMTVKHLFFHTQLPFSTLAAPIYTTRRLFDR